MLNVQEIPLSKLVPSKANVRKAGRNDGVKALAASIKAHGLLQNLTVRKGEGDSKGRYEVVAGGRRLAALQRLAKKRQIAANTRVPCHVLEDESAEEISLAENVGQCPMHPADQYEAFAKLHHEQNMPAADIAARFGVSEMVVRQRLKLGSVSPKLIKRYRAGDMTLEQLTAFTITDDHKAQERVWRELPEHSRRRGAILHALTETQVPTGDRRAIFIGVDAYQAAGGTILRDLFDENAGGFLTDTDLLNRLVREKLQRSAKKVIAEGWKWVSVEPDFDHELASGMRRIHPRLTPEDEAKRQSLQTECDALYEAETDDNPGGFANQIDALEEEIGTLADKESFRPEDMARAGAFVCLDTCGDLRIERGYVRKEDMVEASAPDAEETDDGETTERQPKSYSDKLMLELTAARTSAMRAELAGKPDIALTAVVHALALNLFYRDDADTCLEITARQASLLTVAPGLADGRSETHLAERHVAWEKRLPEDSADLWGYVSGIDQAGRMDLLAHCAALSIDAVHDGRRSEAVITHTDRLAAALKLDMKAYWQPTAANYFSRVSKDCMSAALREAGGADVPLVIFTMKKQEMAQAAESFMDGKGWLPEVLRTPQAA